MKDRIRETIGSSSRESGETKDVIRSREKESLIKKHEEERDKNWERHKSAITKLEKAGLDPMTKFLHKGEIDALYDKQKNAWHGATERYNSKKEEIASEHNAKSLGKKTFSAFTKKVDSDYKKIRVVAEEEARQLAENHSTEWADLESRLGLK